MIFLINIFSNYEAIGNIFGFFAMIFVIAAFQCKSSEKLLIYQSGFVIMTICSYYFLKANTGMLLNVICLVRNVFYYMQKRFLPFKKKYVTYFFTLGVTIVGFLSWQGFASLLIIIALGINTYFLSKDDSNVIRKSIIFTSSLAIIYDIIFHAYFSMISELLAIISSIVGLIRFSKKKS